MGILPENGPETVARAAKALGYPLDTVIRLTAPADSGLAQPFTGDRRCSVKWSSSALAVPCHKNSSCPQPVSQCSAACVAIPIIPVAGNCQSRLPKSRSVIGSLESNMCSPACVSALPLCCSWVYQSRGGGAAGGAATLRAALARYTDLWSPVSKPALQALAAFASGPDQARLQGLLSPGGAAEYKAWHQQSRSLLEVLEEFPGVRPPLGAPAVLLLVASQLLCMCSNRC